VLLLLASLPVFGAHAVRAGRTGVIVLMNGDRVTGEIPSLANGLLTFRTNDIRGKNDCGATVSNGWPMI
jgi:hypothetical protein